MAAAVRAAAHAASRVGACGGVAGHTTPSVVSIQRLAASYSLSLSPNACRRRTDGVCSRCFAGDIWPACDELVLQLAAVMYGSVDYSIAIRVSDVFFVSTSLLALIAVMRHARHFLPRLHRLQLRTQRLPPTWARGGVAWGWDFVLTFVSTFGRAMAAPAASGCAISGDLQSCSEVGLGSLEVYGRYRLLALSTTC